MVFHSDADLSHLVSSPVSARLPAWLFGGNLTGLERFAGWDMQSQGEKHLIRNCEAKDGSVPNLIRVVRVGSPLDASNVDAFGRLRTQLEKDDEHVVPGSWQRALQLHERFQERFGTELVSLAGGFKALFIGAEKAAHLPQLTSDALVSLTGPDGILPDASTHLIWTNQTLGNRYGLVRVLLNSLPEGAAPADADDLSASSRDLLNDVVIGLSSYLEPLVTSLSPRVWGTTATRAGGVLVILFGRSLAGRRELSADILSMSARTHPSPNLPQEDIDPLVFRDALKWWVSRLDLAFSHLTEPSNYEVDGEFSAPAALERLMTFEQVCRSVQVIASNEDSHARRLALFHVLDSMEGLNPKLTRDAATNLTKASAVLASLRASMPPSIQPVLLPRAESAVEALRQVQDGFFVKSRLRDGEILMPDSHGVETWTPLATAARGWLKVLRNSQHGFERGLTDQERALLALHNGHEPAHLPNLAWLALLNVLTHPELLRRLPRTARGQRRQGR